MNLFEKAFTAIDNRLNPVRVQPVPETVPNLLMSFKKLREAGNEYIKSCAALHYNPIKENRVLTIANKVRTIPSSLPPTIDRVKAKIIAEEADYIKTSFQMHRLQIARHITEKNDRRKEDYDRGIQSIEETCVDAYQKFSSAYNSLFLGSQVRK
jgi:hypothetical protein